MESRTKPHALVWFPRSEEPHWGIPPNCEKLLECHFHLVWLKDLLDNPTLGLDIQAAFGYYCDPVTLTIETRPQWFPNLKTVVCVSTGFDHMDMEKYKQLGIRVYNCVSYSEATAEHAFLLILATARDFIKKVQETKTAVECVGSMTDPAPGLSGSTLGVIGLGKIGTKVAKCARIFDTRILYHNRRARDSRLDEEDGFVYASSLALLLQESDYILVTCPLTDKTRLMIGREQFKMMKSTAAIVNVARAEIIDQDALLDALQRGKLRSAALDVTSPPVLPTGHPLLTLPNVIITNHCGYCTHRSIENIFREAVYKALDGLTKDQCHVE
ncbi:glyoxylate reductase/hydroxypyruvate reductase-like [Liolophura sinensis]|uniref:glyoxylate reductase/hydroxypyruvate reductase-like n=1 Tax=Liolophura sinensis TaxID=3198878 RepID=UPI0031592305